MTSPPKLPFSMVALVMALLLCLPAPVLSITIQEEEEMAEEMMKSIHRYVTFVDDAAISQYVDTVGRKVLAAYPRQHFTYHFYVIDEQVYNAFATPAGHIFINSGLIAAMESEEELAGIISHEIAHVHSRHISQKIELSKKLQLLSLAGMVASILIGSSGSADASRAAGVGTLAAGQSIALKYSREDEIQADQLGLKYLTDAGFNGGGLLTILKKMRAKNWYGSLIPNYLSTHPATESRIAYIDTWLQTREAVAPLPGPRRQHAFLRTKTRITALYSDEDLARSICQTALANTPDDPMAWYGWGLVQSRSSNRYEALRYLKMAAERFPLDGYMMADLGLAYFSTGHYDEAIPILENARTILRENPDIQFYLGRAYLATGATTPARLVLERLVDRHHDFYEAYFYLGKLYSGIRRVADAHYHLGIYYFRAKHKLDTALHHLGKALDATNDADLKKRIEKTTEEIEEEKERAHRSR